MSAYGPGPVSTVARPSGAEALKRLSVSMSVTARKLRRREPAAIPAAGPAAERPSLPAERSRRSEAQSMPKPVSAAQAVMRS